ncbi:hypothetical protein PFISCL1PPCAC_7062 [Pristionchus fissidentatus]|uniref:G protein-coupled receptor n=1 Tax=Pristionchus fissidentatus TaxID=1538716 RepID=A0AAV5VCX3_9BILA|nr:hypothetical protein PFISCL1PPCAC_7062 [Pristionchus fissidentatus]
MSDVIRTLTLVFTIIRVICWVVLLVVATVYIRILSRRKVFHPNLHLLLLVMPFSYLLYIVASAANLTLDTFNVVLPKGLDAALHALADCALFGSSFNLFCFTFERLIATWKVDKYEHISSKIPYIALLLISAQWMVASAMTTLLYLEIIPLWPMLTIIGVQWAISIALFIALPEISRRAYQKEIKNRATDYKNRYQSVENVRTALVLNRLVLFLAASLVFQLTLYTLSWFVIPKDINPPVNQFFHVLNAVTPSIGCLLVLFNHPSLRRRLPHIMKSRVYAEEISDAKKETTTSSSCNRPSVQVRSLSGQELVVPTENHRDAYFDSYRQQWN